MENAPHGDRERVLVIKAKGGLGNRILSAVTGCVLADLIDRVPCIDWRDGMYLNRGQNLYPELFEAHAGADPARHDTVTKVTPAVWSGKMDQHPADIIRELYPNSHSSPFIYRKLCIDLDRPDPDPPVAVFFSYLPKMRRLRRRLARSPNFRTVPENQIIRDILNLHFRPVAAVRQLVDDLMLQIPRPVIGVHIRYTDRKVPLPKILQQIERLRGTDPHAVIFLATDSAEAQEVVTTRFDRVLTLPKVLRTGGAALHINSMAHSDPLGEARAALADMLALSRCNWLVHSRHSTFSVAAALLGGIAEHRQFDVDRHNAKVVLKRWFQARA